MKVIKITLRPNGSVAITKSRLFETEHLATTLIIDYAGVDYVSDFYKFVDFHMADNTSFTLPSLSDATTEDVLAFELPNYLTKKGSLVIQPYASLLQGAELSKVIFAPTTFNIEDFILSEDDATPPDTTLADLIAKVSTIIIDLDAVEVRMTQAEADIDAIEATLPTKMNVDGNNSNIDTLNFDRTPATVTPLTEGQVRWNELEKTVNVGLNGGTVVGSMFEETFYPRTKNADTVEIQDGDLVMYAGAQGNSGVILIKRAIPNMALPGLAMGIATMHIPVGQEGKVTWFGMIRGIQTNGANYGETWVDGDTLYNGTTTGSLSKVKPVAPRSATMVGIVVNAQASNGILFVRPQFFPFLWMLSDVNITNPQDIDMLAYDLATGSWKNMPAYTQDQVDALLALKVDKVIGSALLPDVDKAKYDAIISTTKEVTGFTNNANIGVSYNSTTRQITLTGTFQAYYQGALLSALTNGWVSPAHVNVAGNYYLYYNGTDFVFTTTPWEFYDLMIAYVQFGTHNLAVREVHGFMPHVVHTHLHQTVGTFKQAGGDFTSYTLNSVTAINRRPNISSTTVMDEDLATTLSALTSKTYTQRFLSGAAVRNLLTDQAEMLPVLGSQPYYNQNVGGVWQQTLFPNNNYGAIFVVAIPTSSDTNSQKYRYMFVQPQQVSATQATIQSIVPSSLIMGDSSSLVTEFVFIARIVVRYTGGDWTITSIDKLDGTKISQVAYSAGNYLSAVNHDATLTGDGTSISPLGVVNDSHTHDTQYYTEAEVDTKDALKADKLMATNLVTNGDFSNGTTGWLSVNVAFSIVNGEANILKSIDNSDSRIYQTPNPATVIGRVYYVRTKVKATTNLVRLYFGGSFVSHSGGGAYETLSIRHTAVSTVHSVSIYDTRTSGWDTVFANNILVIDLTAIFGAGLEPSKEQIDRLLSIYPNSWFNGTSELTNVKQLWNEKTDRILATNLLPNMDFSNGTTGWTAQNFTVVNVSSNIATILATASGALFYQVGTWVIGHKYYFKASVKATHALVKLQMGTTATPHSGSGNYENLSLVHTATTTGHLVIVRDDRTSGFDNIYVKWGLPLDLTEIFGAGKEPTAVQMDNLLANFPNSWFNGTVELASLINILNTKADKTQEAWITPTLTSSWVNFDVGSFYGCSYMKDSMGFVHLRGLVKNGGTGASNPLFTLPAGYRPSKIQTFPVNSNTLFGVIQISSFGLVTLVVGTNAYVYLDSITFKAEA